MNYSDLITIGLALLTVAFILSFFFKTFWGEWKMKRNKKIKVECRICVKSCTYHGGPSCLRAWVKGGPQNCTSFEEIRKDRQ